MIHESSYKENMKKSAMEIERQEDRFHDGNFFANGD